MTYDLTSLTTFVPENSIINEIHGGDAIKPYSYTQWLEQSNFTGNQNRNHSTEYNKYIREWNDRVIRRKTKYSKQDRYKLLIKNISLNYTTDEEKRFLTNIDYDNERHVAAATTFFAKKIQEISTYYSAARQNIKQSSTRAGTTGSITSIERLIYNEIPKLVSERSIIGNQKVESIRVSKTKVSVNDLYEVDAHTQTKIPIVFDKDIFIDIQQSIENLVNECLPVLEISPGISLTLSNQIEATDTTINLLDYENFIDYTKSPDNLNIYNVEKYLPKLTGADMYTISDGELSLLFVGENKHRNILHTGGPHVITSSSKSYKTRSQLGRLFVPSNMGVLSYYSHKPITTISTDTDIQALPDPYRINTTNVTLIEDNVEWVKASSANDGLAGDIVDANRLPKFFSYRSDEETKLYTGLGTSRSYDPVGFFTGYANSNWANADVFSVDAANIYDIDSRQDTLMIGDHTVTSWSSDIYGNQYALYKKTPTKNPSAFIFGESEEDYETNSVCVIIDGGNTLKPRPKYWSDGVSFKIYEGGRRWGIDSKIEQQINMTLFEDLRQMIRIVNSDGTTREVIEEKNAWDFQPNKTRTEMVSTRLTYHGFKKKGLEPVYDEQAYGGLFTDQTCGQIDPSNRECVIRDNYAFSTFSDVISALSGENYYVSASEPLTGRKDAFEVYFNTGYSEDVTFSDTTVNSATELFVSEDVDAGNFTGSNCFDELQAEFVYEIESDTQFYNKPLNISRTKLTETEDVEDIDTTQYTRDQLGGEIYYRSYNDAIIKPLTEILAELAVDFGDSTGTDRERFIKQVDGGVLNMEMFFDVIYIQTEEFIYLEKVKFDEDTNKMLKSDYPSVLVRTEIGPVSRHVQPIYNKRTHELVYGQIMNDESGVYPKLYITELNGMTSKNVTDTNIQQEYTLTSNLSSFVVERVDEPILSYNDTVDVYTLTYSCKLSGDDQVCYGICISDYEHIGSSFKSLDVTMNHTTPVKRKTHNRNPWDDKVKSKTIRFNPKTLFAPTTEDVTTSISLSSIIGEVFDGYQLKLTFDTRTLPVNSSGAKINQIIFNPDNGDDNIYVTRLIETGFEPINFDIGDLPDQSDLSDPRAEGVSYEYRFSDNTINAYVPTLTAVYSDHKKLIVQMQLELEPYTIESGFDDIKVIDTKTYSDSSGHHKQLIVTETTNPRYISHSVLTKNTYTNADVIGIVNGAQYRGEYHRMSDGTLMTGSTHSPSSLTIT